ncbi:MAG: response regulator [Hyphomicrobiaceae bacterium]|nr:response regulator [Hyphomicrobiaceae bacterium]
MTSERVVQGDLVLVVDDSPETLGFLTDAMQSEGTTVLVARSGQSALDIVEKITPDAILMDAVMPGLDGFETCRRLKLNDKVAHVPVIFMTGLTETVHVVRALESGGVDYLTKPIDLDELRARVRVHLANARRVQGAVVALDAAGRHILALGHNGTLRWATPQARRLLDSRPGLERAISERAAKWLAPFARSDATVGVNLPLGQDDRPGTAITYLGRVGPDEYLFRCVVADDVGQERILQQSFALTPRESEVLIWIARGKSNRDVGDILGLSPRTVNKHLEQVFSKLGVENRASAAVLATRAITEGGAGA